MQNNPATRISVALLAVGLGASIAQAQLLTNLTAVDVGAPPLPGSTTVNGPGSFAVAGSGEYKNSAVDSFHFAYTHVTGDFDYQVRIESLEVPSQWSKVGLMARETADATVAEDLGSRSITMATYPPPPKGGNTLILIRREQADTPTADDILGTTPVYPNAWLRLRRLGTTLIGYTGTNGLNWDVQGVRDSGSWPDGPLSSNLLLGLAAASATSTATVAAQAREFGPTPSTRPVAISVPLKAQTVNKAKAATFSVTVSGYDPFYAQWYTNGIPISGGTNYSFGGTLAYTTAPLSLAEDNTRFSVVVSNSVGRVTSGDALLRVLDDSTPPVVTAATADATEVNVIFDEEVSPATALIQSNYTLTNAGVDLGDVALSSNQRVAFLTVSGAVTETNATVTVKGVQDLVGNTGTSTVPLWLLLPATNIVASGYPSDREQAFASVTDASVDAGWQTSGDKDHRPQFAGLIYGELETFGVIRVDLGEQNEFGGSFTEQPRLYLLKNSVDTDLIGPETDPANWQEIGAHLVSPNLFDGNVDLNPSPASPIIFDLSALSPGVRAGFGWAVGGVRGDNSGFIRVSELRAYGQSGGAVDASPTMSVSTGAAQTVVIAWPTSAVNFVLKSSPSLSTPAWALASEPKVVVGSNYTVTAPSSNGTRFFRLEK